MSRVCGCRKEELPFSISYNVSKKSDKGVDRLDLFPLPRGVAMFSALGGRAMIWGAYDSK